MPAHSIGNLARAAGVPTSTVRYYERRGLLTPDARTASRYRQYGEAGLGRLRFIRAAQETGLTLEDIATLLELRDAAGTGARCAAEVRALLADRLADIERKLADLAHVRDVLADSLRACRAGRGGRCAVIEGLTLSASKKK